jgi:hypothetical protein
MSGFDSKRQASKELLKQALDALLCCSPDTEVGAALQIKTVKSLRAELAQQAANPWLEAIDNALICTHLGTVDSFPDAGAALDALIDWHVAVALDPEVSSDAQALIDRGAAAVAEPVAWRRYNRSIGWQYEDGVTSFASDPSAEPLYAAPQAVAEPLSAERVNAILMVQPGMLTQEWFFAFARAVEQAHGIKGSAA